LELFGLVETAATEAQSPPAGAETTGAIVVTISIVAVWDEWGAGETGQRMGNGLADRLWWWGLIADQQRQGGDALPLGNEVLGGEGHGSQVSPLHPQVMSANIEYPSW